MPSASGSKKSCRRFPPDGSGFARCQMAGIFAGFLHKGKQNDNRRTD
jgi:hypothetical protein